MRAVLAALRVLGIAGLGIAGAAVAQVPAPGLPPQPLPDAAPGTPGLTPPPPAPSWLPRSSAMLLVLDKVVARVTPVTVPVGGTATVGSLSIRVGACVVRPPDAPADAAAFLDVTDKHAGPAPFRAWMIRSIPAASVFEHPVYDISVAGCGT